MRIAWKRARFSVRPRASGKNSVLLCTLAFCLTVAVVYGLGYARWAAARPLPTYTATANLVGNESRSRTPFSCTDADPQRAVEMANARAEHEAVERRTAWRISLEEQCKKARESMEKAQQDFNESVARLETFERQEREAAQSRADVEEQGQPMMENPRWLEAKQELSRLEQRRDQLLVDRTPLHPAVREIADEISAVQGKLAAIPRQIVDQNAKNATAKPTDDYPNKESQQKRAELTAAVESSRLACENADRAAKEILQKQQAGPQLVVQYATAEQDAEQALVPADVGWQRLVWTSLMASVLMTFGVGAVSAGVKIEPPVATAAEVEDDLGLPVLGAIPGDGAKVDVAAILQQYRMRRTAISLGLLMMLGCPLLAIWGIVGI